MGAYANPIFRPASGSSGSDVAPGASTYSSGRPTAPGGANQYFPVMPTMPAPSGNGGGGGVMPNPGSTPNPMSGDASWFSGGGAPPSGPSSYADQRWGPNHDQADYARNIGHGIMATGLQYPGESQGLANFLSSQIGKGTPANPLLQQLLQFFQGGSSSMPGANTMSTIANQGISALPEWQSMVAAMQHNTGENQANLREQFAGMGDLAGSPFGTAMSDYMSQTNLDQNALLGQLQQTNILQGQIPVAQALLQGGGQMSEFGQSLLPQNSPLLPFEQGMATLFPPTTKTPTTWENINSTISALSGAGGSFGGSGGGGSFTL